MYFPFLHIALQFSHHYLLKRQSFLQSIFLASLSKSGCRIAALYLGPQFYSVDHCLCFNTSTMDSVFVLFLFFFLTMALQYTWKSGMVIPPSVFNIFLDFFFCYHGSFVCPYKFWFFFSFVNNFDRILMGIF